MTGSYADLQAMRARQRAHFEAIEHKRLHGEYRGLSGHEILRAEMQRLFDEPSNPATRQYNRFAQNCPANNIAMAQLLGLPAQSDLTAYNDNERQKIAEFIRVAKAIVPYFSVPTSLAAFKHVFQRIWKK
ncbi:hypothetical protein [Necropsobacter rosorum]|uniref:hypothetical protein n=1 Tax=Necropsobacter rosorum TaxID=908285 RepID=UPI000509A835